MRAFAELNKRSGFTLVELLVAVALFGILMVAFLSLFMSAFRLTLRAGDRDTTVAEITGKVEQSIAGVTVTPQPSAAVSISEKVDGTITFNPGKPEQTTEPIKVDIATGTAKMDDGTDVVITGFETAGSS